MAEMVSFEGTSGNGANINLNVPMPGTHTGRRLIVVADIPDSAWNDSAKESGTSWSDLLHVEFLDGVYTFKDSLGIAQLWKTRNSGIRLPDYDDDVIEAAMLEISKDADLYRQKSGSLKGWVKGTLLTSKGAVVDSTADNSEAITKIVASLSNIESGIINVPTETWAGTATTTPVDVSKSTVPRLIIVQVYGISPFLGNYGLGRTVKTFTLLPGEETKISTKTWRSTESSVTEGSSIVDSYDSSVGTTFGETLYDETTDSSTQSETENWSAEAEASGNWGVASASVSASASGEYSSSSEEFAKATSETVSETAYSASSARQNTVTSSSEYSETSGSEFVTERTIKNINVKRVLNFVFRELNQEYIVKTHLKDIRIAFANGNAGCWREVPISGLRGLLEEFVVESAIDGIAQDILSTIATIFDLNGDPVPILEMVESEDCGDTWQISDAKRDGDCAFPPPTTDGKRFYRFKRGDKDEAYALNQSDEEFKVPGVLMRETTIVMRTDSVVVEALLGTADALDDYSIQLQEETIRQMTVANDATAIATEREALGIEIVKNGDSAKAELFEKMFVVDESASS